MDGTWKALLRVHDGRVLSAMPIPEVEILQRELKDSGGGLWTVANLVVLFCALALIDAIPWGVGRYSRRASVREPYPDAAADPPAGDDADRMTSGLGSR